MPIYGKAKNEDFERPEPGSYPAVVQSVHYIGIQKKKDGTEKEQIIVFWEIAETMKTGKYAGKHFVVNQRFNLSMSKSSLLRKMLEAWRGKNFASDEEAEAFDIEKIVGQQCLLGIADSEWNGKTYTNVKTVGKSVKGMQPVKADNPPNHIYEWVEKLKGNAPAEQAQRPSGKITPATDADDMSAFVGDKNIDPWKSSPADAEEIPF
jgi:hypothetical protein